MADKRSVYRVNYYLNGQPVSAFVVALNDNEASTFLGVRDGSAAVSRVAWPVEVSGQDLPHAIVQPPAINVAPVQPAAQLNDDELAKLREFLRSGSLIGKA